MKLGKPAFPWIAIQNIPRNASNLAPVGSSSNPTVAAIGGMLSNAPQHWINAAISKITGQNTAQ